MQIAAIFFCLAGLIMSITSLVIGKIVPFIPIGNMFVCIGMVLLVVEMGRLRQR